jgi:polar amino acid transport system permease protein
VTAGGAPGAPLPDVPGAGPASRRSRILDSLRGEGARGALIATISTVTTVAVIIFIVLRSPGWSRVRGSFFDVDDFAASLPDIVEGFWLNVRMFVIAELLILVLALVLAVVRSLRGPAFFPLRAMAVAYTDLFRGVPTLLVILLLGFGMPALRLRAVPSSQVFWAVVALVLVYSAYVAEVYRAGIVVIPQAVRRVVPPLLNDFVGLQKDTALVAVLGVREAVREAQIYSTSTFTYTSYLGAALLFVVVTIPLARLTDYLIERERSRRQGQV